MRTRVITSAPLLATMPLHARIWRAAKRTCASIGRYALRCQDAYAAAVLYQELSRLSDTELERRGIGRGDLHRHVFDGPERR